jgi:uncharacterized protein GlcG (DUF336 family)
MFRLLLLRIALAGAVTTILPLANAQLLTHRDLSYAMAKTIAEAAIDSCKAKGYAVSAVVVDEVIAGVGVSGSPGVDEPCVQDGLDKVADQLK